MKPMKTLSIRQPWAWLIAAGHKDIENRPRRTNLRGPILIHASLTIDQAGVRFAHERGIELPFAAFITGGIIGQVEIVDCVSAHVSPWFFGPFGYVLKNPKLLPFRECRGMLGFFEAAPPVETAPPAPSPACAG